MNTITVKFLEAQVLRLNRATGSPEQPYAPTGPMEHGSGNSYVAQIGNSAMLVGIESREALATA